MKEEKNNLHDTVADYVAFVRRSLRYWKRAVILFVVVFGTGMCWVVTRPRVYRSQASAVVHDLLVTNTDSRGAEEAHAELTARLDLVYGSRSNLGRIIDELNLYPWLRGRTSRLKVIESFREALSYTALGRDAFEIQFVYKDPRIAQRTVERLLRLYTEQRREAGEAQARNDLGSVNTALAGLEAILEEQEGRLERFERVNHTLVEQVRLRRMGQIQLRTPEGTPAMVVAAPPPLSAAPGESSRTRRLRIRLAALQSRQAALQRALESPMAPAPPPPSPVPSPDESERLQTLRRNVTELRERLARLRTTYTDEYPDVQITLRRLGDAERELASALAQERSRSRPSVQTVSAIAPPEAIRAQLDSVQREIEQVRAALAVAMREQGPSEITRRRTRSTETRTSVAGPSSGTSLAPDERPLTSLVEVEATWDRLLAELTTTRTRYQTLLTRKFELQAMLDTVHTSGADVLRVIDPPSLPQEPEPPGRTRLAVMVLVVAIALSTGVAVLSGILDSRLYEPGDLRRWGELPELPAIPDLHQERV